MSDKWVTIEAKGRIPSIWLTSVFQLIPDSLLYRCYSHYTANITMIIMNKIALKMWQKSRYIKDT